MAGGGEQLTPVFSKLPGVDASEIAHLKETDYVRFIGRNL